MISLGTFIDRRRRWATLAVVLGMLFLVRLGFWQLDRLEWRRGLNAEKLAALNAPAVPLSSLPQPLDAEQMVNRLVLIEGRYDFEQQLLVETQVYEGRPGRYLLTPLQLANGESILVNRGWLPEEVGDIDRFNGEANISLVGRLQPSQTLSGNRESEVTADRRIYRVDVGAAADVMPYPIMSMYLLPEPLDGDSTDPPLLVAADLSLDEGSHLSYAIQWFTFALMLAVIYVVVVYRQERLVKS